MKINRRLFLASGLAAAAGAVARPAQALAGEGGSSGTNDAVVLATLLDISKCIACGACVEACRETNGHKFPKPTKPFPKMYPAKVKAADWSDKQDVDDRLTPYNWLYIQTATGEYNGEPFELNIPRRCLHCQNPPCANLCPWGAASKDGRGIVSINDEICLGGSKCKSVCPWHIPERQTGVGLYLKLAPSFAGNGVMYKCDRCRDLVAQGKTPACIEPCPEGVQTIGPRDEIRAMALKLAEETGGFIYGDTENGGTNTFYVSPVPFDVLDQAVEQGAGKPHLASVGNPFVKEEQLARAVYAAPFVGLVAGVLHLVRGATSEDSNE
ncbi:MAG: 4Fe-4S ferredoxin [Deltaproteobacteria bacterium HGW-Deltaproteobacteria-18]|nr:MAG: 4Fe-4S ferredoxin [Deltaproteobacteria bacterium HGW-Deltaproteobacteria-18]